MRYLLEFIKNCDDCPYFMIGITKDGTFYECNEDFGDTHDGEVLIKDGDSISGEDDRKRAIKKLMRNCKLPKTI